MEPLSEEKKSIYKTILMRYLIVYPTLFIECLIKQGLVIETEPDPNQEHWDLFSEFNRQRRGSSSSDSSDEVVVPQGPQEYTDDRTSRQSGISLSGGTTEAQQNIQRWAGLKATAPVDKLMGLYDLVLTKLNIQDLDIKRVKDEAYANFTKFPKLPGGGVLNGLIVLSLFSSLNLPYLQIIPFSKLFDFKIINMNKAQQIFYQTFNNFKQRKKNIDLEDFTDFNLNPDQINKIKELFNKLGDELGDELDYNIKLAAIIYYVGKSDKNTKNITYINLGKKYNIRSINHIKQYHDKYLI
jgi:hypothetical protein